MPDNARFNVAFLKHSVAKSDGRFADLLDRYLYLYIIAITEWPAKIRLEVYSGKPDAMFFNDLMIFNLEFIDEKLLQRLSLVNNLKDLYADLDKLSYDQGGLIRIK